MTTLLEPDKVRSKSLEIMRARRSAEGVRTQSGEPKIQKMHRRGNSDEALSDAENGMAGPKQEPITQSMNRRRKLDDVLSDAENGMAGPEQKQVRPLVLLIIILLLKRLPEHWRCTSCGSLMSLPTFPNIESL